MTPLITAAIILMHIVVVTYIARTERHNKQFLTRNNWDSFWNGVGVGANTIMGVFWLIILVRGLI